jgi:hypothetical protein
VCVAIGVFLERTLVFCRVERVAELVFGWFDEGAAPAMSWL